MTTALITGASGGIGYELAKIHAANKGDLVLVARSIDKLEEIKRSFEKEFGISVLVMEKDLSKENAALEVFQYTQEHNIQIDYLINNAGFGDYGPFSAANWDKQKMMIDLNIIALTQFTKLYLDEMIQRKSGKILNVASVASFLPGPLMSVYYATKAFVLHFSEAIANEVKEHGITVTALCPGPTESGFYAAASLEDSKLLDGKKIPTSKQVAIYGYKAMLQGKVVAIHGFSNKAIATFIRFMPRGIVVKLARRVQSSRE
ncbi:MAG: SDR family oxidoreductase [Bacteroidota bacterium]